ncbi:MAG: membrane protein of unknown function [Promethearchaeota archaeon]|jgi:putative ABC transport system permease protein|nr:MAG: membrane protein of unknown function [Candidatus Lokiarchaeota archaeon]
MLKFSIKNAFRKKLIAILASVGVGFGLMLVFVIGAFTAGVNATFQDNLTRSIGIIEIQEEGAQLESLSRLPIGTVDEIFETPDVGSSIISYNVETAAPSGFTDGYNSQLPNTGDSLTLVGINKSIDGEWEGVSTKITSGRLFNIEANETIIDSRLPSAATFNTSIGDKLEIDLGGGINVSLEITGIYNQEDLGAPSFVPRQYYIYTDMETLWNLLNLSGQTQSVYYTSIILRFDVTSIEETNSFVDKINDYSDNDGYTDVQVEAFSEAAFFQSFQETFEIFDSFAGVIGLITVLAGGMAIIVTQLLSVSSRMKEFAILKATGWKNRHIFENVIFESLTLGIVGALIGMGIGSFFIYFLSSGASPFGGISAIITYEGIIEVLLYALGLGILGGLYPGLKAARVRPVRVLKGE